MLNQDTTIVYHWADERYVEDEAGKTAIIEAIGDQGSVLAYFEFEVCDTRPGVDMCIHDGPLDLKLKLPEGMAGYDNYKLIYVEVNENNVTTETAIDLTLEDGYLVGTLAHLSGYALIGSNNLPKAPDTGIVQQ